MIKDAIVITASFGDLLPAEALMEVIEEQLEPREFSPPLEFEVSKCRVREGRRRTVKLFSQYPELVDSKFQVRVLTLDADKAEIHEKYILMPVEDTNYAVGVVSIGDRALNSRTTIISDLDEHKAKLMVNVVKDNEKGAPLYFETLDEDFSGPRAVWNVAEMKSNQLLIS